ncbi:MULTISPECIES: hypothetical protein [unclassified Streptomyces]|uniref:hypothetical protein n=1 Tax=unclassified Streptomyces TaxID=2593676 RepID=UPI0035DF5FEB
MPPEISRRTALLTAVGGALAMSALHSGAAQAVPLPATPRARPFVTTPRESGALYDSAAVRTAHAEPLNAAVGCAAEHGGKS